MSDFGKTYPNDRFLGTVTVGAKGQFVVPKAVRDMLGIVPGSTLLIIADKDHGAAFNKIEYFNSIADNLFKNATPADPSLDFAQAVREANKSLQEESE